MMNQSSNKNLSSIRVGNAIRLMKAPYTFERRLGKGKYGVVFEGVHYQSRTKKALKVVNKNEVSLNELEIMMRLPKHPNLLQLRSYFALNSSSLVFVLDLCQFDLRSLIRKQKNGKLSEVRVKQIMRKLAAAVSALHKNKIFHRDIKSENIFLNFQQPQEGKILDNSEDRVLHSVKLGDFGLSTRFSQPDELFSERWGSPFYMAPEIWGNSGYTPRSDLYSCGMVMFEMLSGNPLFYGVAKSPEQLKDLVLSSSSFSSSAPPPLQENALPSNVATPVDQKEQQFLSGLEISNSGKDLLSSLLQPCSENRIDFEEFPLHSWFEE